MKIIIPGGSGQVGTLLARAHCTKTGRRWSFSAAGQALRPGGQPFGTRRRWASGQAEFDGADAVINLAGRSVNCRYTPENRRAITDSRVNSVRVVGARRLRGRPNRRVSGCK